MRILALPLALVRDLVLLLVPALVLIPGCHSESTRDSGSGPMSLSSEAPVEGASVVLRHRAPNPLNPLEANRFIVDVVARGAGDLHGAALRVTWDPEALSFSDAQGGPEWSKQALALAKEGSPGQLAVVWAERGELGIDASRETVIGTLTFRMTSRKSTALAFMQERSQLVDRKGVPLLVTWQGGVRPR